MAFWNDVAEHHVRQAVAEYDRLGQDKFLAHYGFSRLGQALAAAGRAR